jgi:hypothetical protein
VFILFLYPAYTTAIETNKYAESTFIEEKDSNLLRDIVRKGSVVKKLKIVCFYDHLHVRHYDVINYYKKLYKFNNNIDVSIISSINELKLHDTIIINQPPYLDSLTSSPDFKTIQVLEGTHLMTRIK